jgi:pimeloyl-ACP methyl ester carboxylesterase
VCYRLAMPTGDGVPSFILLPGTLCDERVFAPMLRALKSFGTGKWNVSVKNTHGSFTLTEAALQVLADAPQRFFLLGFSLGGLIALQAALLAPERVQALVLLGTTAAPVISDRHAARRAQVDWARKHGTGTLVGERLWSACVSQARQEDAALRSLLSEMAETLGAEAFHAQTELALTRPDLRADLRSLTMPALVLGGIEDEINPPAVQQELVDALENATLVLVKHAGHFMLLEEPDEVARHVAAWFNKVVRPAWELK